MWDGRREENVIASGREGGREGGKTEDEQLFFIAYYLYSVIRISVLLKAFVCFEANTISFGPTRRQLFSIHLL